MIVERLTSSRPRAAEEIAGGTLTDRSWLASLIGASGMTSTAGQVVTPWTAEGIPAIYATQRAISETVGQLPLKLMKRDGENRIADEDNPLYTCLHDLANPEQTAYEFKEMLTRHLAGWGRAYGEIVRDGAGRVTALWPLLPWRMEVDREPNTNIKRWTYSAPNGQRFVWRFDARRPPILHLKINSIDGLDGRSPIRVLMDSIGMTQAVNQFGADFFNKYAAPAGILKHKAKLSPTGRQHLREEWEKVHGTWGNKHRVAILQEDMGYERISCPPDEAQFIETRAFQIEESARIYRVPLFVIGHMTKQTSWGSGVEQMMLGWLATGLQPYLVAWKQVVKRDCLTQKSFNTHDPVWVERALLRTDFKTRMEGYGIQIDKGMLNPNEARGFEDLNPRTDPFGNDYHVPTNNATPSSLASRQSPDGGADTDDEGDE